MKIYYYFTTGMTQYGSTTGNNTNNQKVNDRLFDVELGHKDPKILALQQQIHGVKQTMVENIDRVIEREKHLINLTQKTEDLTHNSEDFRRKSTNLKRYFCAQHCKCITIWIIIALILLAIIIGLVIGLSR